MVSTQQGGRLRLGHMIGLWGRDIKPPYHSHHQATGEKNAIRFRFFRICAILGVRCLNAIQVIRATTRDCCRRLRRSGGLLPCTSARSLQSLWKQGKVWILLQDRSRASSKNTMKSMKCERHASRGRRHPASNSLKRFKTTKKLLGKAWKSLEPRGSRDAPAPTASPRRSAPGTAGVAPALFG
jgi:hypothetical protein